MDRNKLIYDSHFFRSVLGILSRIFSFVGRWKIVGNVPDVPKYVAIGAPHTSNWDFPLFMCIVGTMRLRVRFLGKDSLFKGFFGGIFYYLGGIPVKRNSRKAGEIINQAIELFEKSDRLMLGLSPEGTRTNVVKWKTGFYRIAVGAGVPILLAYVDASKREVGLGPLFYPTGNFEQDLEAIQLFYKDKKGVKSPRF